MKKTLVALAALASVSAFAQSSVTMYGIVDVGFTSHTINDGTGGNSASRTAVGSSGQSSSRLGFTGTEDLGGGLKAGFTFETGLKASGETNGTYKTADDGSQTLSAFNNRQAFVSLTSDKAGTLAIGTQYTPAHVIQAAYNAGGSNNVIGDVTYTGIELLANKAANAISGLRQDQMNTSAYLIRASNSVAYVLPTVVPGVTAAVAVAYNDTSNSTSDSGMSGKTGLIKYDNGPLSVGASYLKGFANIGGANTGVTGVPNTSVTIVTPDAAAASTNVEITNSVIGGSYDLGVAKAFFTNTNLKTAKSIDNTYNQRVANKVGVSTTYGNWVPFAQYGVAQQTANSDTAGWKNVGYQIGTSYNFSKRTNAYFIYGNNKAVSFNDTTTADKLETQYAIGLRHQF